MAVIGAGNVGCALAADLVLAGFDVRLSTRSAERRRAIQEAGGVTGGGAMFLAAELSRRAPARSPCIGQLTTSSHGARLLSPTAVRLFGLPVLRHAEATGSVSLGRGRVRVLDPDWLGRKGR